MGFGRNRSIKDAMETSNQKYSIKYTASVRHGKVKELVNRTDSGRLSVIPCPTMNYGFSCVCRGLAEKVY